MTRRGVPHSLKIARYRDRLLSVVRGKIAPDMYTLLDSRSAQLVDKLPNNSEIAYFSDMVKYLEFCHRHNQPMLPFVDSAIDLYLSYQMAAGKSKSTLDRYMASLAKWAKFLKLDDPRGSFMVDMRRAELRRKARSRKKQAGGIRVEHLNVAIEVFDPRIPRDCQDITLLFVGWETLCRRSELVGFNWADLEIQQDGSGLLYLESSKTDQDGEGNYLYLSPYTLNILLGWRSRSRPQTPNSPIFRGIYSDGSIGGRLSSKGVDRCYKRIAARLGIPDDIFSGHSARVGAAQEMIERGIDSAKVMLSGRWKSMAMLANYTKKINAKRSGMADLTKMLAAERSSEKAYLD